MIPSQQEKYIYKNKIPIHEKNTVIKKKQNCTFYSTRFLDSK